MRVPVSSPWPDGFQPGSRPGSHSGSGLCWATVPETPTGAHLPCRNRHPDRGGTRPSKRRRSRQTSPAVSPPGPRTVHPTEPRPLPDSGSAYVGPSAPRPLGPSARRHVERHELSLPPGDHLLNASRHEIAFVDHERDTSGEWLLQEGVHIEATTCHIANPAVPRALAHRPGTRGLRRPSGPCHGPTLRCSPSVGARLVAVIGAGPASGASRGGGGVPVFEGEDEVVDAEGRGPVRASVKCDGPSSFLLGEADRRARRI